MEQRQKRPAVSPELEAELAALIREGKKISATKRLRQATGAGLAEAKAWVDDFLESHFRAKD
jgi:ribosomal protein L7/L12